MFGGKDSADSKDSFAKLPDGLGAHEGQETLEPSREVRRRESKLHSKRHAPDISDLRLDERPTVGWECLAEWTALTRGARTPDFPTARERARAQRRSNPVGKSGEGSASCIRSTTRRTFPTYSLGACKGQETLEAGGKPRHQAQNSKFVFGQRNGSTTRLERLATSSSRR